MPVEALGHAASQHAQSVFNLGYALVLKHKDKDKQKPQYVVALLSHDHHRHHRSSDR